MVPRSILFLSFFSSSPIHSWWVVGLFEKCHVLLHTNKLIHSFLFYVPTKSIENSASYLHPCAVYLVKLSRTYSLFIGSMLFIFFFFLLVVRQPTQECYDECKISQLPQVVQSGIDTSILALSMKKQPILLIKNNTKGQWLEWPYDKRITRTNERNGDGRTDTHKDGRRR